MTNRYIERQLKQCVLPKLPDGFAVKRYMLFHTPIEWFIRGYGSHGSDWDKAKFRGVVAIAPLFLPEEGHYNTLLQFLGTLCFNREVWWRDFEDPQIVDCILSQGEESLRAISTPLDFALKATDIGSKQDFRPDSSLLARDIGYAYILAGRQKEAAAELDKAEAGFRRQMDGPYGASWDRERLEQVLAMQKILGDEGRCRRLLSGLREAKLKELGLERFAMQL